MSARRFPLSWPSHWPRTKPQDRQRADFGKTKHESYVKGYVDGVADTGTRKKKAALSPSDATARLEAELDRLGATEPLLSTSLPLRLDGTPRSDRGEPSEVGAAVYFKLKGKPLCLACDKWLRVADNIAALAQHIDALRRIERYGVGRLEQAFAGYTALPPTGEDWAIVLMVAEDASRDEILKAHRQLASIHHPDKGGRAEDMARINFARDRALERKDR